MPARGPSRSLGTHALDLLALAGDTDLDRVLDKILRAARDVAGARYAALGVPDGRGGFGRFLTAGIGERRAALIGDLPRVHGVLGALLEDARPIMVADIREHPRFSYFPRHHPVMTDFLGVPIVHRGEVLGNLFLAGSRHGRFRVADRRAVTALAGYAGVAIANARLYEQAQELAVMQERNRVARELHDAVSQSLFSMVYEARAAALRASDGAGAEAWRGMERQAAASLAEMRNLVHALRPKSLEGDGLAATLADHVDALRRTHGVDIHMDVPRAPLSVESLDVEHALLRIAQEALHNALKHGAGAPVRVTLSPVRGATRLTVADRGPGFDPALLTRTVRTMGLRSMRDRAAEIGASLRVVTAPGRGSRVEVTTRRRGGAP